MGSAMTKPPGTARPIKTPSNRSFGLVFTGFFLLVGLVPLLRHDDPRWWALGASISKIRAGEMKLSAYL